MSELRVGIIGLGFMGKTHLAAYASAARAGVACRVVAVADANLDAALAGAAGNLSTGAGGVDLSNVARLTSPESMIAREDIDAISLCTPTDTHVDLAIAALRAGKHVLIEKPVALRAADVRRVAAAAGDRVAMPAMCMRFWPGWTWLKEQAERGTYGRLESATFQRLGAGPTWNAEFYRNPARSGGALTDLHIHDADFVCHLFGKPAAVVSAGTIERVTTMYRFANGPRRVVAEGGWMHHGFAFTMRYIAAFERATAVFDLAGGEKAVTVYADGNAERPELPGLSGYEAEVRHFLSAIDEQRRGGVPVLRATLDEAAMVAEVLEAERRSLETGREVALA